MCRYVSPFISPVRGLEQFRPIVHFTNATVWSTSLRFNKLYSCLSNHSYVLTNKLDGDEVKLH